MTLSSSQNADTLLNRIDTVLAETAAQSDATEALLREHGARSVLHEARAERTAKATAKPAA